MASKTCGSCVFFKSFISEDGVDDVQGNCHRYPANPMVRVHQNNWCGEWAEFKTQANKGSFRTQDYRPYNYHPELM